MLHWSLKSRHLEHVSSIHFTKTEILYMSNDDDHRDNSYIKRHIAIARENKRSTER